MLRRHRFGVPALLIVSVYLAVVAGAAVLVSATGELGALWRVTLFTEVDEDAAVTWPNVLVLCATGLAWAWALWQSLRGPLAGPSPILDRGVRRLRAGLYAAAAASWLFAVIPSWPRGTEILYAMVMCAVVEWFQPVLRRNLTRVAHMGTVGVLGYGGSAVFAALDGPASPVPDGLPLVCVVAALVWTVLALRAQWRDGRWRRATVRYGIAALLAPLGLMSAGPLLALTGELHLDAAGAAVGTLMLVWLARSAHELADPPRQLAAPPAPLSAQPHP
ncbi:hypothetical protein PS9374_07162 [Planomonospora sphaerica]|uniref:Uncharacterized protein n=1 Tax=Planomonospora sphaerica TaxID=161355 RepID=A0A171DQY6_9ACTN|nr:hypothetical protein PS9374_07162 [Planomonospora sphaerica]